MHYDTHIPHTHTYKWINRLIFKVYLLVIVSIHIWPCVLMCTSPGAHEDQRSWSWSHRYLTVALCRCWKSNSVSTLNCWRTISLAPYFLLLLFCFNLESCWGQFSLQNECSLLYLISFWFYILSPRNLPLQVITSTTHIPPIAGWDVGRINVGTFNPFLLEAQAVVYGPVWA